MQRNEALKNAAANVAYLTSLPDSDLVEKLELVHVQMEIAEQKKNTPALELLEIWRSQIIEARIFKRENNIPDAPDEIESAIADIETITTKAEERSEILTTEETPLEPAPPAPKTERTPEA